jgi:hypothetical protein
MIAVPAAAESCEFCVYLTGTSSSAMLDMAGVSHTMCRCSVPSILSFAKSMWMRALVEGNIVPNTQGKRL